MKESETIGSRVVLDASVIIDILAGSSITRELVQHIVEEKLTALVSRLNLVEALYVLCRFVGLRTAEERVMMLLSLG